MKAIKGASMWRAGRYIFLLVVLWSGSIYAQDHFVVVRSSTPRDTIDRYWEPVIANSIVSFLRTTQPELEIHSIALDDLQKLGKLLNEISKQTDSRLRGIAFTGHGSSSHFYMSGQDPYSGGEFGNLLINQLSAEQLHPDFVVYINSCLNFDQRPPVDSNFDFEKELGQSIQNWISPPELGVPLPSSGEQSRVNSVGLVGHQSIAGWLGLLPTLPSDRLYKALNLKTKANRQADIKIWFSKLYTIAGVGALVTVLVGEQAFPNFFGLGINSATFLAYGALATVFGASFWNYISKLGRLIHIHKGYAKLDENLWVRQAFSKGFTHGGCKEPFERVAASKGTKIYRFRN